MAGSRNTGGGCTPGRGHGVRLLAALGSASLLPVLAPAASVAAAPTKDPLKIACPPAPVGWFNPPGINTENPPTPGGKVVLNPETDPQHVAGSAVNVSCDYFSQSSRHIIVEIAYALPSDLNPINDFYFGCSSAETKWNETDRIYRKMASNQWAIGLFTDVSHELTKSEVPIFESLTRQLLQNADGYAHMCNLTSRATVVTTAYLYNFRSEAGSGNGSFEATGVVVKTGSMAVSRVTTGSLTLRFEKQPISLRVTKGVSFYPARPNQKASLKLAIQVKKSQLPSCAAGNTGTLTLTSESLVLRVCSQSFSAGNTSVDFVSF